VWPVLFHSAVLEVGPSALLVAALIAQRGPSTVGYAGGSVTDWSTDFACDVNKLPRNSRRVLIDIGEKEKVTIGDMVETPVKATDLLATIRTRLANEKPTPTGGGKATSPTNTDSTQ
jgi:hypothetical protein